MFSLGLGVCQLQPGNDTQKPDNVAIGDVKNGVNECEHALRKVEQDEKDLFNDIHRHGHHGDQQEIKSKAFTIIMNDLKDSTAACKIAAEKNDKYLFPLIYSYIANNDLNGVRETCEKIDKKRVKGTILKFTITPGGCQDVLLRKFMNNIRGLWKKTSG